MAARPLTKAQLAAYRLMSSTPKERIHTHAWEPLTVLWGRKRSATEIDALRNKLEDLRARGFSRRHMKDVCGCTNATIIKFLGREPRRGRRRKCAK